MTPAVNYFYYRMNSFLLCLCYPTHFAKNAKWMGHGRFLFMRSQS